jgi:Protein of unknown function (DUF4236)
MSNKWAPFSARCQIAARCASHLSLSGVGVSVGGRGAHVGVTARGQRYSSIGLPGTGLSWREYHKPATRETRCDLCAPGHAHFPVWLAVVIVLAIVIAMIAFASVFDMETTDGIDRVFDRIRLLDGEVKEIHSFYYPRPPQTNS